MPNLYRTLTRMTIDLSSTIELLTIDEVADFLRVSQMTVRRLQQGRKLPFLKVSGVIRFSKADILEYLGKQRIEAIG
jgi:excisionase family DNA binding protein